MQVTLWIRNLNTVELAYQIPLDLGRSKGILATSNTRFNRFAQVIAMDGMYAGFAGARDWS